MSSRKLPNLTFPMIAYGRYETPWDLRPLLYRGGSAANVRIVRALIDDGKLGKPLIQRVQLVSGLHEVLIACIASGVSKASIFTRINWLRQFIAWIDRSNCDISCKNVESAFRLWADSLLDMVRLKQIKPNTAYGAAATVSTLIDKLNERDVPIIKTTRLKFERPSLRAAGGIESDKLNLAKTFDFGHFLLDVIQGLTGDAIWGPLPIKITLRSSAVVLLWNGLRPNEKCAVFRIGYPEKSNVMRVLALRAESHDRTLNTRRSLINLRLQFELLIFIAQTGMNLAQAHQLQLYQFSYISSINGYEVRDYKNRRHGEVLFEIFAEYRAVFENYLAWRKSVFPDSDKLFPFICQGRHVSTPPAFRGAIKLCEQYGITYFAPKALRKVRVNWLLRESRNPDLTAEQAQHTKQTLLRVYHQPSLQVAMREIVQFWPTIDPSLPDSEQACLVAGSCDGNPRKLPDSPNGAPEPNCLHPAGCLFCDSHRDIDSEDYVWSLTSMHFLSKLVLSGYRAPTNTRADQGRPMEHTVNALYQKINWFTHSNRMRANWVTEAFERIDEGDFHPHWRVVIESVEKF